MTKISTSKPPKTPQQDTDDIKPDQKTGKAGHRKATVQAPDKPAKAKFSLSALARNIGKAILCRNIDVVDTSSKVQKKHLPEPSQTIEDQRHPLSPDNDEEADAIEEADATEEADTQDLIKELAAQLDSPDSGVDSDDETEETDETEEADSQDLIKELAAQLDSTDSGIDSVDESDQGSSKKPTRKGNSEQYNMHALALKNYETYPVRGTIEELEELTDPIQITHYISVFLDQCRAKPEWRDNPLDLNMGALNRVQSIIIHSPLSMKEKNDLFEKMAKTALSILLYQTSKYSEKEAFAWLDVYEQILLSNTYPKKLTLYDMGHGFITNYYGKQDPWHAQIGRLDKGQGSFLAFVNLVLHFDDEQKLLMMKTFLREKKRKIHRLEKVIEQYKALNDGSMDNVPMINNPRYVELLELSAEETSLRKRVGDWTEPMVRMARNILNDHRH